MIAFIRLARFLRQIENVAKANGAKFPRSFCNCVPLRFNGRNICSSRPELVGYVMWFHSQPSMK